MFWCIFLTMKDNFVENQKQFVKNNEIGIKEKGNLELINLQEIVKFESDRNYTVIYLINGRTVTSSRTLQMFEKMLYEKSEFLRVNRKELINLHYASFSEATIVIENAPNSEQNVKVSRRRVQVVTNQIMKFNKRRKTSKGGW